MASYAYEARNRSGELFKGKIKAASLREAAHQIRAKGLWVASLRELEPASLPPAEASSKSSFLTISSQPSRLEVVLFCRQLAVMLSAGLPVHEALKALRQSDGRGAYQQMLNRLLTDVIQGKSLHEALQGVPKVFPPRIVSMVKAGEAAGSLDVMFLRLADFLEKSFAAREKLKSVLLYPFILGVTTLLALLGITVFILPTFAAMLSDFRAELPLPTKLLLDFSALIQQDGMVVLLCMGLLVLALVAAWHQPVIRCVLDAWRLRIPLYGRLLCYAEWQMLLGTLSVLLANGICLHEALKLLPEATNNHYLRAVVSSACSAVERGTSLWDAWHRCETFPEVLGEMVRAGEKSGELEGMLEKGAGLCGVIAENESARLQSLAEPAAIFIVGGLVFFFALSVLLPLLGMMEALS
ncbi:MAG: type II secretion system F family protein [Selenomonadaceae bacterium]|nr:type II secretion system F family protein [Selenomonadaceae bacterium]